MVMKFKGDDLTKKKYDANFVNLSEEWEVRDACVAFNCTRSELAEAVKKVGNGRFRLKLHFIIKKWRYFSK